MFRSKKVKVVSLAVVVLAVLVFGLRFITDKLNSPSYGYIAVQSKSQAEPASINMSPNEVVGKYASFNYPSGMSILASSKLGYPFVGSYNYSYQDIRSWGLSIEILNVPSGSLDENSSFQFRKLNPQTYQESQITEDGKTVYIMTDTSTGGFAKVAFLVGGQYQAIISLNGDDSNGSSSLQSTFNMIINSWKWSN